VDPWAWLAGLVNQYGYLGAFAVSVLGNLTILIPVPSALVVYAFGSVLDPLFLGIVSGIGATVGEFSAYLVGRGGRMALKGNQLERLESVRKIVGKYGAIVVFLFALLPLPDDLLLVPLGVMGYDWRKILVSMLAGKTMMCLVVAYAGALSFGWVKDLFGESGVLGAALSAVALAVIVIALLWIDWEKVAVRFI